MHNLNDFLSLVVHGKYNTYKLELTKDLYGMELYNFYQLPHQKRLNIVRKYGVFLVRHSGESYSSSLYALGNFFAEIWELSSCGLYPHYTKEFVIACKNVFRLEPYWNFIDISEATNILSQVK
ncbi:MAG: hypothetical protein M3Q05_06195 [Bacteroidota bacterium]|nr:hypothetical protein [Bacteroidota bacterium]